MPCVLLKYGELILKGPAVAYSQPRARVRVSIGVAGHGHVIGGGPAGDTRPTVWPLVDDHRAGSVVAEAFAQSGDLVLGGGEPVLQIDDLAGRGQAVTGVELLA